MRIRERLNAAFCAAAGIVKASANIVAATEARTRLLFKPMKHLSSLPLFRVASVAAEPVCSVSRRSEQIEYHRLLHADQSTRQMRRPLIRQMFLRRRHGASGREDS